MFAGIFGLILYLTFSYILPRMGATTTATLPILAQLMVAVIIDHMGWPGVLLLIGGAYLASR